MPSVARATRLYGSLKDRFAAVPAERVDTNTGAHDQAAQEREITPYIWVHPDYDR
jgi:hypothetical protein